MPRLRRESHQSDGITVHRNHQHFCNKIGTKRTQRDVGPFVRFRGWSQRVDATLYPERERWSVRQCVEVIFEALRHQRKQSFGIAGSGGRVAESDWASVW